MITLYHSPQSRSTSILSLLRLMGKEKEVTIKNVQIQRQDGQGGIDPKNPHPEGKVPLLQVGDQMIRERGAIMLWLTDHFDSPLGRGPDDPARGAYLSWLFYYSGVVEPVLYLSFLGMGDNPMIQSWCRDTPTMMKTLETGLAGQDFLLGDRISAADLLIASPFTWFPDLLTDRPLVAAWVARCEAAQDTAFIAATDSAAMEALGLKV